MRLLVLFVSEYVDVNVSVDTCSLSETVSDFSASCCTSVKHLIVSERSTEHVRRQD